MLSFLSPASVFLFDEETEDSSQQPDKAVPSAYAAFSVLVVDDDFLGREVASCFLETLGVGSISIAVNGFEGLRMLTTHAPFTLVLMDLVTSCQRWTGLPACVAYVSCVGEAAGRGARSCRRRLVPRGVPTRERGLPRGWIRRCRAQATFGVAHADAAGRVCLVVSVAV